MRVQYSNRRTIMPRTKMLLAVLVFGLISADAFAPRFVSVCHKGREMSVRLRAVAAHVAHGDCVGGCDVGCD